MGKPRVPWEVYLSRFIARHSDLYDYSESKETFVNSDSKIRIKCKVHGYFYQDVLKHAMGHGCHACAGRKLILTGQNNRRSLDYHLSKCTEIHKNKYNYSKVINDFKGRQTDLVTIICPIHGEFKQHLHHHIEGKGCKICGLETLRKCFQKTVSYYVERFRKVHGDYYDYSLYTQHINSKQKIKIKCPKHGIFKQDIISHASGSGCNLCGYKKRQIKRTSDRDAIIKRFNIVHDNRYNYDFYNEKVNQLSKIYIVCKTHGLFKQYLQAHLKGSGCPKCNSETQGERAVRKYLELRSIKYETQKIFPDLKGISGKNPLRFDFYLPVLDTCIEFDGLTHTLPVFGQKALETLQINDQLKNKYCKKNCINLIRVTKIADIPLVLNGLIGLPTETAKISYKRETGWFIKEHPIMCN